ncbi:MAG TPA: ferritin family protein [Thermotogota bacterium]|nr:ferritin family protein [Thermotogota bacterium]HRW91836.1 ferritin family protein [Thermotogota bacterium]
MLQDLLKLAITYEESGVAFYQENQDRVSDPLAKKTFEWLAGMEADHVRFLQQWQQKEDLNQVPRLEVEEIPEFFETNLEKKHMEKKPPAGDFADLKIIRLAYLIEKDFVHFYRENAKRVSPGEGKEVLQTLAKWEEKHMQLMKRLIDVIFHRNQIDGKLYPAPY